jgi:hypothetical protein
MDLPGRLGILQGETRAGRESLRASRLGMPSVRPQMRALPFCSSIPRSRSAGETASSAIDTWLTSNSSD